MSNLDLAQLLVAKKNEIVERFVTEVERTAVAPAGLGRSLIADHIPTFLDAVAFELSDGKADSAAAKAVHATEVARRHGQQRWNLGYNLDALIREYGLLRRCILKIAEEAAVALSIDEFDALAQCLNVGIAEATTEYAKFRDAQFDKQRSDLQFLVNAGTLLSSSLDYRSTLNRLTRLLVPQMADWCSIHLDEGTVDEMPLAHVDPEKTEILRELYRSHPAAADAPRGHLHVMKTGEPEFVGQASAALLEANRP